MAFNPPPPPSRKTSSGISAGPTLLGAVSAKTGSTGVSTGPILGGAVSGASGSGGQGQSPVTKTSYGGGGSGGGVSTQPTTISSSDLTNEARQVLETGATMKPLEAGATIKDVLEKARTAQQLGTIIKQQEQGGLDLDAYIINKALSKKYETEAKNLELSISSYQSKANELDNRIKVFNERYSGKSLPTQEYNIAEAELKEIQKESKNLDNQRSMVIRQRVKVEQEAKEYNKKLEARQKQENQALIFPGGLPVADSKLKIGSKDSIIPEITSRENIAQKELEREKKIKQITTQANILLKEKLDYLTQSDIKKIGSTSDIQRSIDYSKDIKSSQRILAQQLIATADVVTAILPVGKIATGALTIARGTKAGGIVAKGISPLLQAGEKVVGATGLPKIVSKVGKAFTPKVLSGSELTISRDVSKLITEGKKAVVTQKGLTFFKTTSPIKEFLAKKGFGFAKPKVVIQKFNLAANIDELADIPSKIKLKPLAIMDDVQYFQFFNPKQERLILGQKFFPKAPKVLPIKGSPFTLSKSLAPEAFEELLVKQYDVASGLRGVQRAEIKGFVDVLKNNKISDRRIFKEIVDVVGTDTKVRVAPGDFFVASEKEIPIQISFKTGVRQFGDDITRGKVTGFFVDDTGFFRQEFKGVSSVGVVSKGKVYDVLAPEKIKVISPKNNILKDLGKSTLDDSIKNIGAKTQTQTTTLLESSKTAVKVDVSPQVKKAVLDVYGLDVSLKTKDLSARSIMLLKNSGQAFDFGVDYSPRQNVSIEKLGSVFTPNLDVNVESFIPFKPRISINPITLDKVNVNQNKDFDVGKKSFVNVRNIDSFKEVVDVSSIVNVRQDNLQRVKTNQGFKLAQFSRVKQAIKPIQIVNIKTPVIPPVPVVRVLPSFRFGVLVNQKKKRGLVEAFDVEIREKGKFRKIAKGLPKNLALKIGSTEADISTARTFRLSPSGFTSKRDIGNVSLTKFREPFGGSKLKQPLTFIEKSKFAISSKVEKVGIPGRAAQLRKVRVKF